MATTETKPVQLALFEGQRYPTVDVKFGGGVKGEINELLRDAILERIAALKVGDDFTLIVSGHVAAKKHAIKITDDGPERTLTVALKVDDMRPEDGE